MHIDFTEVDDVESFLSIPEGNYYCRVAEVRPGQTREGEPRWSMRLEVTQGDFAGRTAAWDSLSWSERGTRRAKYVLSRLGFEVDRPLNLEPADLVGREVVVEIIAEEWQDPSSGQRVVRPKVPFMGYGR